MSQNICTRCKNEERSLRFCKTCDEKFCPECYTIHCLKCERQDTDPPVDEIENDEVYPVDEARPCNACPPATIVCQDCRRQFCAQHFTEHICDC